MNAAELHDITKHALEITGEPFWTSKDDPQWVERLVCVDDDKGPFWAFVPFDGDVMDIEECVEIQPAQAASLLKEHLRAWLLAQGWQVQYTCRQGRQRWRLADCLSSLDGGGDRLETDYPHGDDELAVLCRSVRAVARADLRYRAAGP